MKQTIIIVITVITLLISANKAQNITCDDTGRHQLDLDVQRLSLYGSYERRYPTNNEELKIFCSDNYLINNRIKEYKEKCLDSFAKELVTLMTYTTDKETKAICDSPRRSKDFVSYGVCGNAAKNETVKCWQTLVYNMEGILSYIGNEQKVPLICCNFYAFKTCTLDAYDKYPRECKQSSIDGLDQLLDKFSVDVVSTICDDYQYDNDKCDRIIGLTPKPNNTDVIIRKSPVLAFIEIINSINQ